MIKRHRLGQSSYRIMLLSLVAVVLVLPAILPISHVVAQPRADWTFMVYMDADNNLDYFGYQNIEAMMSVGSTNDVNIVVLWDKYDDVANLYHVGADELNIVQGFSLNGEEVNMGDPDTLRDFVTYTTRKFHARHYVLVMWDHGDDFRGCCWDDHPEDYLTHQEIIGALSGIDLDIMAFDMCVSGMIEVVYEYACFGTQIDYVVATEGYVPNWGYPYAALLDKMTTHPEIDAFDLSKVMVDEYIAYYETKRPASRLVQMAVIDMTYVTDIVEQLGVLTDDLEDALLSSQGEYWHEVIAKARGEGNMGWSEYGWEAYIDLPTFVNALAEEFTQASALQNTLMDGIYSVASRAMESAEGMGIFFPNSYGSFKNNAYWHGDSYLAMQFPYKGFWDFLQAYWGL
ncbi:MAG: clostripain-related cysteine peptidase [Candidatus Thorarchaeota archaeon]